MASELKLSGQTARVILQGNDTITSDQTFTFPDTGGEVATIPAGGSAVGYQSGLWSPDFKGEGGNSWWILNGVPNGNAAETWSSFTWNRIGQTVTLSATLGVKVLGVPSDTDELVLTNIPYKSALGNQLGPNTYRPFVETCMTSSFSKATTTYTSISAVVNNMGAASGIYSGEMVYFLWNNLNLAVVPVQANQIAVSGQIYFTLQYLTDDTTWTPINGATVS